MRRGWEKGQEEKNEIRNNAYMSGHFFTEKISLVALFLIINRLNIQTDQGSEGRKC